MFIRIHQRERKHSCVSSRACNLNTDCREMFPNFFGTSLFSVTKSWDEIRDFVGNTVSGRFKNILGMIVSENRRGRKGKQIEMRWQNEL